MRGGELRMRGRSYSSWQGHDATEEPEVKEPAFTASRSNYCFHYSLRPRRVSVSCRSRNGLDSREPRRTKTTMNAGKTRQREERAASTRLATDSELAELLRPLPLETGVADPWLSRSNRTCHRISKSRRCRGRRERRDVSRSNCYWCSEWRGGCGAGGSCHVAAMS